ncbi:Protein of unknown function DUF688 [Macleaya cordata]|uniref:Uncharacterized protein n=1 Tax=Macleaya cordata TaxID=56857 RepID=A0A200PLS2_MACCD|nr:Protein of unknown function DUF688 [Macleaya cordata]
MEEDDLMNQKCPRKLNFNAPILSTRRRIRTTNIDADRADTSCNNERVPFSWEEVPGTPKGTFREDFHVYDKPTPKLPPGRSFSPNETGGACAGAGAGDSGGGGGCDGDSDDTSDGIDVHSLSSLDVEPAESIYRRLDSLDLEIIEGSSNQSPNFIIRRFLPAANALAFSYANSTNMVPHSQTQTEECGSRSSIGERYSEPKACGIEHFFPWRKKLTPCGLKSPVRGGFPIMKLNSNGRRSKSSSQNVSSLRPE